MNSATAPKNVCEVTWFPNMLALASGLLLGTTNGTQAFLDFKLRDGKEEWVEHVYLNSIEREDGSGLHWNMTGYTAKKAKVKIFVRTDIKKGSIEFLTE